MNKSDYALINLGTCIKGQADRLGIEHDGVPLEGVVVRIANAALSRAAAPEEVEKVRQMVCDLIDPDDCWFDHHGGCQAHGYLTLNPGELCPHMEAKQWLGAFPAGGDDAES